jgi:two-component system, NarL family, captular synthesis response regulator RcsB
MKTIPGIIRIAIADDHPVIRHAVSNALNTMPGFTIGAAVKSGTELLDALTTGTWDLIVTDLSMQGVNGEHDGLKLIGTLQRLHPGVPVIVFTMLTNDDILHRLSKTGVAGIVDKREGIGEFQTAVLEIIHHGRRQQSGGTESGVELPAPDAGGNLRRLTKKELEIIRAFAAGASLTDIARQVNRSVSTVATQKGAAMKKLNMRTNADLVRYARESGLV